jgi:elongation factor P hydroxylase
LLKKKVKELEGRITYMGWVSRPLDETLWADWVMEALVNQFGNTVSVNNLSGNYAYDQALVKYLESMGILEEEDQTTSNGDKEFLESLQQYQWEQSLERSKINRDRVCEEWDNDE